jgi:transcriptional regulator with XRE-family HTH domain
MNYKQKLKRIMEITGWTQDHLADLLDVSNSGFRKWFKRSLPRAESSATIDELYEKIVVPVECEIRRLAGETEKEILRRKIKSIDTTEANCPVEKDRKGDE